MAQAPDATTSSHPKDQPNLDKAQTGNDILSHQLLAELRTGDSLDAVLAVPSSREQVPGFDKYLGRDDKLSRSRNPAVNVFRSSFVTNDIRAGWVSLEIVR
jgi:hypothetical protein